VRRSWLRLFWAGVLICGAIVGYLVISGVGDRLLHQEIETQLSRLLAGPVEIAQVDVRFENGLLIEAHGLEAYPHPDGGSPSLRANRVLAWVDILAVLVGRLELSTLILEGLQIRIEQRADGSFLGLPLPAMPATPKGSPETSFSERIVKQLESLDPAATAFLEDFRAADRIEVHDGSATWIDHGTLDEAGTPRELRVELVSGTGVRNWLSDGIELDWSGVFVDGQRTPFPFQIGVRRDESEYFEWKASFSRIPLETAETPLVVIEDRDGLPATLDASFVLTTLNPGTRRLTFEGAVLDAELRLRRSGSIIEHDNLKFFVQAEFDEHRVRISKGRMSGERLGFEFKAAIDRPIRPSATARIESRMLGARIAGIRDLARQYQADFEIALAISRLIESVPSGRIRYLEVAGTAEFQRWLDLTTGRTRELPDDFLFGGGLDQIVFDLADGETIKDLAGEIDWVEDRISLRNMAGIYRGQPLPELNAVFDGVSHLIRTAEAVPPVQTSPPAIPGAAPLIEIFKPSDPDALPPVRAIGLAIDHLDHPIVRFPLRDLRVLIEPLRHGVHLNIREGTWGGAAITGDIAWFADPKAPSIDALLTLGPPPIKTPEPEVEETATLPPPPGRWASGRFELEFRPRPTLPFKTATGFFRLDDADLLGHEVEIQLSPRGQAAIRTKIGLRDPESIELDLSFAITDATLEGMSEFVALPPDLATGQIGATGTLTGRIRTDESFVAELDGSVRIQAKNGLVRTNLPLLLRLGKATEGYNPFADADELAYESMVGTLDINHGQLRMENFELEGPLRVYANVRLDTNQSPGRIRAIVGIFLFRTPNQIFSSIPLLKLFLPGSDRGLIGAYFKVKGPLDAPDVDALTLKTLMSSVPDAIKAPFKAMRFLFGSSDSDNDNDDNDP
jgi:hypothetical protein